MQSEIIEDENGELWIEIPYDLLIELSWSEGVELILEKRKTGIVVTMANLGSNYTVGDFSSIRVGIDSVYTETLPYTGVNTTRLLKIISNYDGCVLYLRGIYDV